MGTALILYGAPGTGKDTVTRQLSRFDQRYELFPRIKWGPGRVEGYRIRSPEQIQKFRDSGEVLYENEQYGSTYVVDRPHLVAMLRDGRYPVVHVGQVQAIRTLLEAAPTGIEWLVVELVCPRDVVAGRLAERGSDVDERLSVYDRTPRLTEGAALTLSTDELAPQQSAEAIIELHRRTPITPPSASSFR